MDSVKVKPMVRMAPESLRPTLVFSARNPKAAAPSRMAHMAQFWSGAISGVCNRDPFRGIRSDVGYEGNRFLELWTGGKVLAGHNPSDVCIIR